MSRKLLPVLKLWWTKFSFGWGSTRSSSWILRQNNGGNRKREKGKGRNGTGGRKGKEEEKWIFIQNLAHGLASRVIRPAGS